MKRIVALVVLAWAVACAVAHTTPARAYPHGDPPGQPAASAVHAELGSPAPSR